MTKILKKMKEIEVAANSSMGEEKATKLLLPFTSILRPIMKILGIREDLAEVVEEEQEEAPVASAESKRK